MKSGRPVRLKAEVFRKEKMRTWPGGQGRGQERGRDLGGSKQFQWVGHHCQESVREWGGVTDDLLWPEFGHHLLLVMLFPGTESRKKNWQR